MNAFLQQVTKIWSELGINQKVSIILAALGVVVGIAGVLVWSSRPQMQLLYGRLEGQDMSEVVKVLDEQGVPYQLGAGGSAVYVQADKVYPMRMAMASKGLPSGGGVGFEIFDRSNFGVSDFVQHTNRVRAVQGELKRTIEQLRGVRSARVMVVMPENRLITEMAQVKPTASVMVDSGGTRLTQESVNSIRYLVASSVEGMQPNEVVVVDANGNTLSEELREDGASGISNAKLRARRELENHFAGKVESMLAKVVGSNQVVARVTIDVDSEVQTSREERFDPEGQVVRTQTVTEDSSQKSESSPASGVGTAANVPGSAGTGGGGAQANEGGETTSAGATMAANTSSTREEKKNKVTAYEINKLTREVVRQPGDIRKVSAAVLVAMRMEGAGEAAAPKPRSPEEMGSLKQMVAIALGLEPNSPLVTVQEMPFLTPPPAPPPGIIEQGERVFSWFDSYGRNLFAVAVAVIMFMLFLRMLKRHRPEPVQVELLDENPSGDVMVKARDVTPRPTPELLNELIAQKPDNVSTALKNWAAFGVKK